MEITDLTEAAARYTGLRESLDVLRAIKPLHRVLNYEEVSLFARIFEGRNARDLARHATRILGAVEAYGPTQGSTLKATLMCYFDSQFNASRAADQMGIHVNTMRQRLRLLRDLSGGWDDPMRALELHVALRLDAILAATAE